MYRRTQRALLALLILGGCSSPTDPSEPLADRSDGPGELLAGQPDGPEDLLAASLSPQLELCQLMPDGQHFVVDTDGTSHASYRCKAPCKLAPPDCSRAITDSASPVSRRELAFVAADLGGTLRYSTQGEETIFIHTGGGGVRFWPEEEIDKLNARGLRTVEVKWEDGVVIPEGLQGEPSPAGWFTPPSPGGSNLRELAKRPATVIRWVHDNLAQGERFGTMGCSGGTVATFSARLFQGIDDVLDYQMMVGGPVMFNVDWSCGGRSPEGRCELDPLHQGCTRNRQCSGICSKYEHGLLPETEIAEDRDLDPLIDLMHGTGDHCQSCDSPQTCGVHPAYAQSNYDPSDPTQDWVTEHPIDIVLNVGFIGSDSMLGILPHAWETYRALTTAAGGSKSWTQRIGHHCEAAKMPETLEMVVKGLRGNGP